MDNEFDCSYFDHEGKHDTWSRVISAERLIELGTDGPALTVIECVWCDFKEITS